MIKLSNVFTLIVLTAFLTLSSSCSFKRKISATDIILDPIYSSNMVFKSGDSIVIRGKCNSEGILAVKIQDGLNFVQANEKGEWKAKFPPIDYKGVFNISIEGRDQNIELNNLITGQVWVVLGNGWLSDLPEAVNEKSTLRGRGVNANVRIYSPSNLFGSNAKAKPSWQTLDVLAKDIKDIYASILGDELSAFTGEPIGIINLSHPATSIQDFSSDSRKQMESHFTNNEKDSLWSYFFALNNSYKKLADSSFRGLERDVLDRRYDDWEWSETEFPIITSKRWYLKNKIAWLRKKVFISEKYITSDFTVDFGPLRGQFDFYFNGSHLSSFKGESTNFKLQVPDSLVKVWTNLITVRMVAGDSLSGLYGSSPIVTNTDSTYRMQIVEGWRIRTYYEPGLPEVRKPGNLWPEVYTNYIKPIEGLKINSVVLTGSIHQYSNIDGPILNDALHEIGKNFESENQFLYLIPQPSYIDSLANKGYYNTIRNTQLLATVKQGWKIVNTMDITNDNTLQTYYEKMVDRLIGQ